MDFDPLKSIARFNNPAHFEFEEAECYVCGKKKAEFFLRAEDDYTGREGFFQYVKCAGCGLVYQNPRLSIEHVKEFYDNDYIAYRKKSNWGILTPLYNWAMSKHDRDKEKLISRFVKVDSQSNVLDVGCAAGTFLLHLHKNYNCSISGVDFKEGLSYPGFEKINFYNGLFYEQSIVEKQFDLVTMWHFFEHDYDPNKTLQMAKKVLKDDGKLIIEVPRLDSFTFKLFGKNWPGVQAPQHTALYSKKSLLDIVQKNDFTVEEYLPYGAFPPYFYIFTGTYFKYIRKGLRLNKIIFPYFLGQFLLTPVLLFQKYLNLSMQTVVCTKQ